MPDSSSGTSAPSNSFDPLRHLHAQHKSELEAQVAERLLREAELDNEKRLLRAVIDLLPDYIYVKDRNSRFLVDNLAVSTNLGCQPGDVIGKTDFDFFPKELAAQFYADEQRVIATGEPLISREEPNYYPLTDSWGWHLTTTVPLRDAGGEIIGIVGVSRDITAHKRMEEMLRENLVHQKVARQLIGSQEQERQRIAAELHDDLGQNLLIVKNQLLLALRASMAGQDPGTALQEALGLVSTSIQDVRNISHNLRPHQLDELGLGKCLEAMVRRLGESSGLPIHASIGPLDIPLPAEVGINLYRIAQESLSNVLKHAQASEASVSLSMEDGAVVLRISDDGDGFQAEPYLGGNLLDEGFGLKVMSERARMLGGWLEIDSGPGKGTTLTVTMPSTWRNDGDTRLGPDCG
jgi:PAS domain S-box-containing protein